MLKLQVALGLECWMVHIFVLLLNWPATWMQNVQPLSFLFSGIVLSIQASPMISLTSKYMMR